MNYFSQIEDDIKKLNAEAGTKHPLVKDAADKALVTLHSIKNSYISDLLKRSSEEKSVKLPQSSDILSPYMMACNYADGGPKLISVALEGIHKLLNYDMIPPGDVKNILRVLSIQTLSPKFDMQMKVLQIVQHMASSLSHDSDSSQHLTDSTICSFITLTLQICDNRSNVSVSSAALGTVRQLVALVMDGTLALFLNKTLDTMHNSSTEVSQASLSSQISSSIEQTTSSLAQSAVLLVRDLSLFVQCGTGEWIRSATIPQTFALDLMYEVLFGWKLLFQTVPSFKSLLHDHICPALKPLLRCLQEDFVLTAARNGLTVASAFSFRVVRIARCVMLNFCTPELHSDVEFMLTVLVHTLQPDRGGGEGGSAGDAPHPNQVRALQNQQLQRSALQESDGGSFRSRFEEASSMFISKMAPVTSLAAGAFNTLKVNGGATAATSTSNKAVSLASLSSIAGFYIPLQGSGGGASHASSGSSAASATNSSQIPSHPAAVALEALLAFLVSGDQLFQSRTDSGLQLLECLLVNVSVSVSSLLYSALSVEANAKELDGGLKGSPLHGMLRNLLAGPSEQSGSSSESATEYALKGVNEYFMASTGAKPLEVFLLAIALLQLVPRILLKGALQLAVYSPGTANEQQLKQIHGSAFLSSTALKTLMPLSRAELVAFHDMAPRIRATVSRVCDYVYERTLDACSLLLDSLENSTVVRAMLGVVSELALAVGILGLSKPCEIVVSVLCRYTVPMWHGQELYGAHFDQMGGTISPAGNSSSGTGGAILQQSPEPVRWRHIQAIVRLLQVVHVIADVISDWDSIVDSLEQLVHYFSSAVSSAAVNIKTSSSSTSAASGSAGGAVSKHEVTALEVDKIFAAVERFKAYSVFLSDDALVKLMTSLVALSMNNLAVNATALHGTTTTQEQPSAKGDALTAGGNQGSTQTSQSRNKSFVAAGCPAYLVAGIRSGCVSFSLQAVIEVTKLNAFRISTVWQMITSHLRMIAGLKSPAARTVSVAATHDVILTSLRYLQNPVSPITNLTFLREDSATGTATPRHRQLSGADCVLSDDIVFNQILPNFETTFVGRDFHRLLSFARNQVLLRNPKLSQSDLLSSLRALATVRFSDVRNAILSGLTNMLQGRGQSVDEGGWLVILDILESVPASMSTEGFLSECYSEAANEEEELQALAENSAGDSLPNRDLRAPSGQGPSLPQYQWPRAALGSAFTCMKLIVDEFLDVVILDPLIVRAVLQCLSVFSSQLQDVNVSLTSVEMLWKVTDCAIKSASAQHVKTSQHLVGSTVSDGGAYIQSVFDVMLKRLFLLSMDGRPEIRHCAMNTLFSAMAAHAQIISATLWRQVFENIIFPLFTRTGARSQLAMRSNEEAIAPELKKGVRMNVHHSRDTAHKQWSETRVLALRGLTRVMRTCARLLLEESWFREVWEDSILVCHGALQAACEDHEVAVAGLDVIVSMLRIVIQMDSPVDPAPDAHFNSSASHNKQKEFAKRQPPKINDIVPQMSKEKCENIENCKAKLWQRAWTALHDCAFFGCPSPELALAVTQKLTELYKSRADHEFRYSENVRVLLEIVVTLSRPRLVMDGAAIDSVSQKQNRVAESQLQRGVMDLLREVQPANIIVYSLLLSALCEVCFAFQTVQALSPLTGELMLLGPVSERLRVEVGEHILLIQAGLAKPAQTELSDQSTSGKPKYRMRFVAPQCAQVMLDVVLRRYLLDVCNEPMEKRRRDCAPWSSMQLHVSGQQAVPTPVTPSGVSASGGSFFSSFATMMSNVGGSSSSPAAFAFNSPPSSSHGGYVKTSAPGGNQSLHSFTRPDRAVFAGLAMEGDINTVSFPSRDGARWRTFFVLHAESSLLLGALRGLSDSQSSHTPLTESVWCNLLACVACMQTPWTDEEMLPGVASNTLRTTAGEPLEPFAAMAANLLSMVDLAVQLAFSESQTRLLPSWQCHLLDSLTQSTLMGIAAISSAGTDSSSPCFPHYLSLWRQTIRTLSDLAAGKIKNLDESVQKRALQNLLSIATESSGIISRRGAGATLPVEAYSVCQECLLVALDLESPVGALVLSDFADSVRTALRDDSRFDQMMFAWLSATADSVDSFSDTLSSNSGSCDDHLLLRGQLSPLRRPVRQSLSGTTADLTDLTDRVRFADDSSTGRRQSHLLLLMPCAVDLVLSGPQNAPLREAAARVVKSTDLQQLMSTVSRLSARNSELEARNAQLLIELASVKSAATLPF